MHNHLKILIVEDELIIAESLKMMLQKLGHQVLGVCTNEEGFHLRLHEGRPDLVLLDIFLNGEKQGIDLAQWCHEHKLSYAYVTSYADEHTLRKALKFQPLDYILKPFSEKELRKSLEMIKMKLNSNYLLINKGGEKLKLAFDDIYWLKAENVYTEIYTKNKKILHRGGLSELLAQLPADLFFKCHRSYAVNLDKIEKIGVDYIAIDGNSVPLSRSKKGVIKEVFG